MARVVITHWVHPEVIDLLRGAFEVIANPTRETLPRKELVRRAKEAQAMMVFMQDNIDEDFLRDCPDLRIVAGASKGYDNIDVAACTRRGVWVTVVPDRISSTAEPRCGVRSVLAGSELEAAANIFEALSGRTPKGAINRPLRGRRKIRLDGTG